MQHSLVHTLWFAGAVCIVCSVLVSSAAVSLGPRQEQNKQLFRQRQIIQVSGWNEEGLSGEAIKERYEKYITERVVDLEKGTFLEDVADFDPRRVARDPATSKEAPANSAAVRRLPERTIVYEVKQKDGSTWLILPIEGLGLWSTLYGYLALDQDLNTIRGITYYEHGETPGLGGEVDNPRWKARWEGRRVFDDKGLVQIAVIKGRAGNPKEDPYKVDGISGATLTCDGVTNMLQFWLGPNGFAPLITSMRASR